MNWKGIGDLVRLRYKLMWAKTRSRNGRIALFVIGYLLFMNLRSSSQLYEEKEHITE